MTSLRVVAEIFANLMERKAAEEALRESEQCYRDLFDSIGDYICAHDMQGRITAIKGAEKLQREIGKHVVWNTLSPVGSRRRDWKKTLVSDGFIMLRHPDLKTTMAMADKVGSELQIYAE